MQRTGFQKALLVLSILTIISAIWSILGGVVLAGGGVLMGTTESAELSSAAAEAGMSQSELATSFTGIGIAAILIAIVDIVLGALGIRAANDATKIKPVWVFAVLGLVASIIGLVVTFAMGGTPQEVGTSIGTTIANAIMFWISNSIKQQANI